MFTCLSSHEITLGNSLSNSISTKSSAFSIRVRSRHGVWAKIGSPRSEVIWLISKDE